MSEPDPADQAAQVVIPSSTAVYYASDGTASMILEEGGEDYAPSRQEVLEYARWLGMDPAKDGPLMWIAECGLCAPLPEYWRPCKTDSGEVYYFNFHNGHTQWDHPCDEYFRQLYQEESARRRAGQPFRRGPDEPVPEPCGAAATSEDANDELAKGGQEVFVVVEGQDARLCLEVAPDATVGDVTRQIRDQLRALGMATCPSQRWPTRAELRAAAGGAGKQHRSLLYSEMSLSFAGEVLHDGAASVADLGVGAEAVLHCSFREHQFKFEVKRTA